ncbi:DUF397 domain-containing protein [Actinocrispum sp. NPDC049592]|uniref:DUF397 domain-containing protein n=1 Tax=Actinocrispum sp. NPDC049592 TaxID=3154835 RepID=UPI00342A1EF6
MARANVWFTSSFSGPGSPNCVEVKITAQSVLVRDTKHRDGGMLHIGQQAWASFVRLTAGQ